MHDGLGWVATALFATSYFCKTSRAMRRLQASAASWLRWHCTPTGSNRGFRAQPIANRRPRRIAGFMSAIPAREKDELLKEIWCGFRNVFSAARLIAGVS